MNDDITKLKARLEVAVDEAKDILINELVGKPNNEINRDLVCKIIWEKCGDILTEINVFRTYENT